MKLTSSAFKHNGHIPSKYTCDGEELSPPLEIADVPKEAKALVLIVEDPDVPKVVRADQMWDHWIVVNLPPTTVSIKENEKVRAILGKNTGGKNGYQGPCPPDREHRYFFKLFALDQELSVREGVTKAEVERAMEGHVLAETTLIGRYERGKKQ
jgi:Raf kinase inhibitor-like YbhB/YbcL family protein